MTYTRVHKSVSRSPSPVRERKSISPIRSRRSRSRSQELQDAKNPGNNLYVTGLSTRVTEDDLHRCFGKEGKGGKSLCYHTTENSLKVVECHLVTDPRSKESRGFAFVTMGSLEEAERCIKYLNRSVLEGRLITVEKAKRKRGRTPTPGRYQGLKEKRGRQRSRSYSPRRRYDRDPYSRDRRGRSRSPYTRRNDDDYDSNRRRRDRSLSAGGSGYNRGN